VQGELHETLETEPASTGIDRVPNPLYQRIADRKRFGIRSGQGLCDQRTFDRWVDSNSVTFTLPSNPETWLTETTRSIEGNWALITGAGKRIGAVIAKRLHAAGANVAVHYFSSSSSADALVDELNGLRAGSAMAVGADIRQTAQLKSMVEQVVDHAGALDILINNASSFYPTPLGEVTEDSWGDLINSNLKAPLFLAQAALPHLRAARGNIINMIDIHARRPLRHHHVYGAAKAGLEMLTRSLARDLAPEIRVNGIAPGAILWPEEGMPEGTKRYIIDRIPLGRPGEPDDIADTALFLVRDAPYVTGQIIAVDGGRSIGW
jgi:pteridine reductase